MGTQGLVRHRSLYLQRHVMVGGGEGWGKGDDALPFLYGQIEKHVPRDENRIMHRG